MVNIQKDNNSGSKRITAIIVTYQSINTIGACLDSLITPYKKGMVDLVVIDNNSSDATVDFVEKHYPFVHLIRNSINLGFGKGCNCGLEYVDTPFSLLLNPDAEIDMVSLKTMLCFMDDHPSAGICGPAVIDASGDLQPSGASMTPIKVILKPVFPGFASKKQRHIIPGEEPHKTDWICGSIMLLRSKMIDEIGGFDPRFFLYFEETDLCKRAMHAGWEIWTVGKAIGKHINAASAKATSETMIWGTISEHYFKSRMYYLKKHYGIFPAVMAEIFEVVFMSIRALLDTFRKKKNKNFRLRLQSPFIKFPKKSGLS